MLETEWSGMGWTDLLKHREQWKALVKMEIKPQVP
jgi:hypothetical protein